MTATPSPAVPATTAPPAISVVLPCHNRAATLRRTLDAYARQAPGAVFEIVAVDDGSSDETPRVLSEFASPRFALEVVRIEPGAGPANARNLGMARARADLLLIAGDDIVPGEGFVAAHVGAHREHAGTQAAVLGRTTWPDDLPCNSVMRHIDGVGAQQFSYFRMRHGETYDFRHFYTSNISLKRGLVEGVTPWFDTSFPYAAYEDAEFAYRLWKERGLRIVYDERPQAAHHHYYSTRSFALRQYRCGLMSIHFLRKHPELAPAWRLGRVAACERLARDARAAGVDPRLAAGRAEQLEESALAVAGSCEAIDAPVVDRLYLALFEYFVVKGMIDGSLEAERSRDVWPWLALVTLSHEVGRLGPKLRQALPAPSEELLFSLFDCCQRAQAVIRTALVRGSRDLRVLRHLRTSG